MRPLLLALALLAAPAAAAQSGFLAYGGYDTTFENPLLGVGLRFATPLPTPVVLSFQPAVEVQFEDDATVIQGDFNLIGEFLGGGTVAPYAGAGFNVFYVDPDDTVFDTESDTDVGLNLLGGLAFRAGGFVQPFIQGQLATHSDSDDAFQVKGGLIFGF